MYVSSSTQLSLEMDERNTSRSSSSTPPLVEEIGQLSSGSSSIRTQDHEDVKKKINLQEKQEPLELQVSWRFNTNLLLVHRICTNSIYN